MPYGTLAVGDLVASSFQNIAEFGEDRLFEYISRLLDAHNRLTEDAMSLFVEPTTERIIGYGGSTGVVFVKTNEYGRADASKPTMGNNIGLPMELNQATVQWTRKWFENHTVGEMLAIVNDIRLADTVQIQRDLRNALFGSTNYTFVDHLVDNYQLTVRRLANADGFALPPDPYGNTFNGATHTHYLATASLTAANVDALVNTVAEHYNTGTPLVLINAAQENAIRGFTGINQFTPLTPIQIVPPTTTTSAPRPALNTSSLYNRQIGFWGTTAAEVWVKPWIPANYIACVMTNVPRKVLAWRERRRGSGRLQMVADNESFPLRAQSFEREYGIGVVERVGAAVLFTGGGAYVDPTF